MYEKIARFNHELVCNALSESQTMNESDIGKLKKRLLLVMPQIYPMQFLTVLEMKSLTHRMSVMSIVVSLNIINYATSG